MNVRHSRRLRYAQPSLGATQVSYRTTCAEQRPIIARGGMHGWIMILPDGRLQTTVVPPLERQAQVCLRWSNDGGHTWGNEHWKDAGASGEYRKRVIWRRLGKARDQVYEVSVSEPVVWRLVDAHLTATTHDTPIPRYATQMAKMQ